MPGRRTPWAIVVTAVLSVLVVGGVLVLANRSRSRDHADSPPPTSAAPATTVGVDGCLVRPCTVLGTAPVAGTTVELIADRGARSGRLRIGGPSSSDVIEVTITDLGVRLTKGSLQCVASTLSACLVRGKHKGGTAGQVVAGRSGTWSSLTKPFAADAGYLELAQVTEDVGPEVIAVQHDCDRATQPDCTGRPVFAQVFTMNGTEAGCTPDYASVEQLPGYPDVALTAEQLSPCG